MHTIKIIKRSLSLAVSLLMSSTVFAETMQHDHTTLQESASVHEHQQHHIDTQPFPSIVSTDRIKKTDHEHKHEHGGQIYTVLELDQRWQTTGHGHGKLQSDNELKIGTDENKLVLKLEAEKTESRPDEYAAKLLYSRMVSDFWDMQAGLGYQEHSLEVNQQYTKQEHWNAVLGLHGLAPYFFETSAYLEVGQDDYIALSFETERDLLLTQKLILQPYIEVEAILNDGSAYAEKTGLREAALGLNSRYEITKQVMPYIDIAYRYEQESQWENDQLMSNSEKDWVYGIGMKFRF
ncbi:copper resistance protein B [Acinetobacter schindleri]|uniref:copper resistance protein B n=1 Tax=Acinetobacter schindleri TaxID=108981 RepID=UPI0013B0A3B0|nr:copper resistance protein B [Acinetobacter schindleri]QIC61065.1 copper resistance protein B [Acinetobacter schindleri]